MPLPTAQRDISHEREMVMSRLSTGYICMTSFVGSFIFKTDIISYTGCTLFPVIASRICVFERRDACCAPGAQRQCQYEAEAS